MEVVVLHVGWCVMHAYVHGKTRSQKTYDRRIFELAVRYLHGLNTEDRRITPSMLSKYFVPRPKPTELSDIFKQMVVSAQNAQMKFRVIKSGVGSRQRDRLSECWGGLTALWGVICVPNGFLGLDTFCVLRLCAAPLPAIRTSICLLGTRSARKSSSPTGYFH